MKIKFDPKTHLFQFRINNTVWEFDSSYSPHFFMSEKRIEFSEANEIKIDEIENGLELGVEISYCFDEIEFHTRVTLEKSTQDVFLEWVPIREDVSIDKVMWPGPMSFNENSEKWVTLLNHQQGLMIPNTWPVDLESLHFDGLFNTAGSTMPWTAQLKDKEGLLITCLTPWDAGIKAHHSSEQHETKVGFYLNKSLGNMSYARCFRYTFLNDCSIIDITKKYRQYAQSEGKVKTLKEKLVSNPNLSKLIGSCIVHTGIKTHIAKDSRLYNHEDETKNDSLVTFDFVTKIIDDYAQQGIKKLLLHLDGWAQPGYDNQHPDYNQACLEAGGFEGMRALNQRLHQLGYQFCIHDQYRDYYFDGPNFELDLAVMLEDRSHPQHAFWAGGKQTYLCSQFAPRMVKRNFKILSDEGIELDGAYLDVFTCNEADECFHPQHRVSRKEAYRNRLDCFSLLRSQQILSSSEEVNEWAISELDFCHYAPYDFMLKEPGTPKNGIPIPLFNLVYHDCVVIPWMMEKYEHEDYFLYGIINGGIPYLRRDGAYSNIDGSFLGNLELSQEEHLRRCEIMSQLHERIAFCQMIDFKVDSHSQWVKYDDNTEVRVDFKTQEFTITPPLD